MYGKQKEAGRGGAPVQLTHRPLLKRKQKRKAPAARLPKASDGRRGWARATGGPSSATLPQAPARVGRHSASGSGWATPPNCGEFPAPGWGIPRRLLLPGSAAAAAFSSRFFPTSFLAGPFRAGMAGSVPAVSAPLPVHHLPEPLLRKLSGLLDRAAPGKGWRELAQLAGSNGGVRLR